MAIHEIILVMEYDKSNSFFTILREKLTSEELSRTCFIGYFDMAYEWQMKVENCPALGGFATIALLNTISIFQKKKNPKIHFEDIFYEQAQKMFETVTFIKFFKSITYFCKDKNFAHRNEIPC